MKAMTKIMGGGLATAGALAVLIAPAALAAPAKDGDVKVAGQCSGATASKLKLSAEDGRIEVEFEVDQNRVGRRWNVVLRQNGAVVRRMSKVTQGPSGSFEARAVLPNAAGGDRITATATRSGETCSAQSSF